MHFGENQLSRSLIGLSPLPTTHPPGFQPWWVRASTTSYSRFTLAMGRSPRFGSTPRDSHHPQRDSNALFGLAFATATPHRLTSPRSITRRLILQKARHHHHHTPQGHATAPALTACRHTVSGTLSLPSRGTFHHSLTVLSAIGHQGVFRLTGWSRQIHSEFHELAATRGNMIQTSGSAFTYGALTHYGDPFQKPSANTTHQPRR